MIQVFKQYIYCNENSNYNRPIKTSEEENALMNSYVNGSVFLSVDGNLIANKIGIQAPPGTKFYINNKGFTDPVIVGSIGSISLDFSDGGSITDLHFENKSMEIIRDNPNFMLIVDILSDKGGVEE